MCRLCLSVSCLLLGFVPSLPVAAQDASCFQRTLPLNIIDSQRRLIRLTDPSYFAGKIDREPAEILSIKPDDRPHRIVILLDSSGSMLGEQSGRKWQMARFVAAHIGKAKLPNTSVALMIFSDKVNEQMDFSQGASAVTRRLLEIGADSNYAKKNVRGTTVLLDAVLSGLRMLGDSGFEDSIYAITDGGDNRSRSRMRDVREALVRRGVRLYVTLLSSENPDRMVPEEQSGPSQVAGLAADTGGFVLGPLGANAFGRVSYNLRKDELRGIAMGLDGLYMAMTRDDLIEVELPRTLKKWSKWSLEFSSEKKAAHKDWLIVYPRELAPCNVEANSH